MKVISASLDINHPEFKKLSKNRLFSSKFNLIKNIACVQLRWLQRAQRNLQSWWCQRKGHGISTVNMIHSKGTTSVSAKFNGNPLNSCSAFSPWTKFIELFSQASLPHSIAAKAWSCAGWESAGSVTSDTLKCEHNHGFNANGKSNRSLKDQQSPHWEVECTVVSLIKHSSLKKTPLLDPIRLLIINVR